MILSIVSKKTVSLYYKIIKDYRIKQIYSKRAGKFSLRLITNELSADIGNFKVKIPHL